MLAVISLIFIAFVVNGDQTTTTDLAPQSSESETVCEQDLDSLTRAIEVAMKSKCRLTSLEEVQDALMVMFDALILFSGSFRPLAFYFGCDDNDFFYIADCFNPANSCFETATQMNFTHRFRADSRNDDVFGDAGFRHQFWMKEDGILDRALGSTGTSADIYPTTERPWFQDAMSGNEGWGSVYKFYGDQYMGQTYTKAADPERNGVAAVDSELVCEGDVYVEFKGFGVCSPETPCDDGQGDCHTDDDCASGLECWHRNNAETRDGYDFCCTGLTASANVDTLDICAVPESSSSTNWTNFISDRSLAEVVVVILLLLVVLVCPPYFYWLFRHQEAENKQQEAEIRRQEEEIKQQEAEKKQMSERMSQIFPDDVARPSGEHPALITVHSFGDLLKVEPSLTPEGPFVRKRGERSMVEEVGPAVHYEVEHSRESSLTLDSLSGVYGNMEVDGGETRYFSVDKTPVLPRLSEAPPPPNHIPPESSYV